MPDETHRMAKLEVCVDTVEGMLAAQNGVDTIELCSALGVGGLTPSAGFIEASRQSNVAIHAMIRPREGDFSYTDAEINVALRDIALVREAGLAGVVFGAAREGKLDISTLEKFTHAAGGLAMTLHRVIDSLDDPVAVVEQAIALGFDRILTSGGQPKAVDGMVVLREMIAVAEGRIEIVVGSGVGADNAAILSRETGAYSFHSSCSSILPTDETSEKFGFSTGGLRVTDPEKITALRSILAAI